MVLSEDILKIKYRKEPFDVFEIEKGTLLTPSAKQFLNEKGIELVIKGEKPLVSTKNEEDNVETEEKIFYEKPKYVGKNGECYFEKPEHMTVVDGNVLISKNSRLIALRKPVSRMLVNVGGSLGGVGATTNLAPAFTLGCGAVGGSSTSDNITPMNLINIRRVATGVRELSDFKKDTNTSSNSNSDVTNSEVEDMIRRIIAEYRK